MVTREIGESGDEESDDAGIVMAVRDAYACQMCTRTSTDCLPVCEIKSKIQVASGDH